MNYNSPDNSISINLGLLPTAILAIAVVASALMLSARKPIEVTVTPAPVVFQPVEVKVENKTTVRPRITIKQVIVPAGALQPTPAMFRQPPVTPIIPDALKTTAVNIGFDNR
jgi:hypothetical protein